MSWMLLLLAVLTVYFVAKTITQLDGPFDVFARLRGAVGQRTWVGRGLHCIHCVGTYVALVVALYLVLTNQASWVQFGLLWFGLAGGSSALYQVVR